MHIENIEIFLLKIKQAFRKYQRVNRINNNEMQTLRCKVIIFSISFANN